MLPGVIRAVAGRPASSQTTPSLPVCQLGLARPQWAIVVSTSAWERVRSSTRLQPSPWPSHHAPQALIESSSMRVSGKPTPATRRPAIRRPRAYQRNSQAGLEVAARSSGRGPAGPAGAVPRRHALAHHGGETVEAAGKLAGGTDAEPQTGLAAIVAGVDLIGAQRGPGELVVHAIGGIGVGGPAHAHGPRAGAGEVIGEGAAQRRLAVVQEGDRAALGGLARRPPFDLDLGAVGLNLALVVDAKEAAGDIDADASRAGCGRALEPLRVVEDAAGEAVHVAGDEGDAASGVAELGLDLLVGIEGGGADLEIVHGEVAEAEVENLMEDVIVARDLRVFRGAEVGKDAVRAQHQEQGLIGARAVGAAAEAVDGLDGARAGRYRAGSAGRWR